MKIYLNLESHNKKYQKIKFSLYISTQREYTFQFSHIFHNNNNKHFLCPLSYENFAYKWMKCVCLVKIIRKCIAHFLLVSYARNLVGLSEFLIHLAVFQTYVSLPLDNKRQHVLLFVATECAGRCYTKRIYTIILLLFISMHNSNVIFIVHVSTYFI